MLSIILPTYNERDTLEPCLREIFMALAPLRIQVEVIVIDDNSPDGTGELAEHLRGRFPLTVLHRPTKLGLGSAVMAGFSAARFPLLAVMDADLSHPPASLPRLYSALSQEGYDFVVMSRYARGGGIRGWPLHRRLASRIACWLARSLTSVRDPVSGFFGLHRRVLEGFTLSPACGFKICLDLLVKGRYTRAQEIPYTFVGRKAGRSKLSLGEVLLYLRQVQALRRERSRLA